MYRANDKTTNYKLILQTKFYTLCVPVSMTIIINEDNIEYKRNPRIISKYYFYLENIKLYV